MRRPQLEAPKAEHQCCMIAHYNQSGKNQARINLLGDDYNGEHVGALGSLKKKLLCTSTRAVCAVMAEEAISKVLRIADFQRATQCEQRRLLQETLMKKVIEKLSSFDQQQESHVRAHGAPIAHSASQCRGSPVLSPCAHRCVCSTCAARLTADARTRKCPICRAPVLMWMQLRVA